MRIIEDKKVTRVRFLVPGDRFLYFNRLHKVYRIENGNLVCYPVDCKGHNSSNIVSFGANSQMKVEVVND